MHRLDEIWERAGCPQIRLIKIDVEGMEEAVLQGASRVLEKCRPYLLLEANDEPSRVQLQEALHAYAYRLTRPHGFSPHNYLAVTDSVKR